jgi:hypothetical protein
MYKTGISSLRRQKKLWFICLFFYCKKLVKTLPPGCENGPKHMYLFFGTNENFEAPPRPTRREREKGRWSSKTNTLLATLLAPPLR